MVSSSKTEGAHVLSAGVRKTIQSLKEIVVNHSDADIYVALKETNMDPNETAQKLLNQDPFHEVKRKRDKKKENSDSQNFAAAEPRINSVLVHVPVKLVAYADRNSRRGSNSRNASAVAVPIQEFCVVRDNRINQNASSDVKSSQSSTLNGEVVITNASTKSNSTGTDRPQKLPVERHLSQALNKPAGSLYRPIKVATSSGNEMKDLLSEKHFPLPIAFTQVETKENDTLLHSTNSSNSYVVGVYSSSSDPVHVPSVHSRSAASVGAIRRDVGVVGPRRHSSENSTKPLSSQTTTYVVIQSEQDGHARESAKQLNGISKSDHSSQNMAPESVKPGLPGSKSVSSNQHNGRPYLLMGHQRAAQPSKEWKPKASLKPSANGTSVTGTYANTVLPPADNPDGFKKQEDQMQDNMSRLNISDQKNVIIAAHIRVSEADRCRLTFGSLGIELDSMKKSFTEKDENAEELSSEPSGSLSVSAPESTENEPDGGLDLIDDPVQSSGSNSPASENVPDHLTEKNECSNVQNLNNHVDVDLVQGDGQSYIPETLPLQDASEAPSFSGYEPHIGYDMSYFHPVVEEAVRGPDLPSSEEVSSSHTKNSIPASAIALVQQQQQQLAQLYPPVHVSHYPNLMPYRQLIPPVYLPPVPMPGYSNSPAYNHPSNGNSYLLMPGNNTRLTPNSLKYGVQQFKPVPTGNPNGFGNFTNPTGYTINAPGVGYTTGHEDSSRLKFKDSLYVPNPQAETSEIWMNTRDLPSMQSASYYNLPGQTPHPAYLSSHGGHASFTPAVAQSSHMQFPRMYHPPTQPVAIASPHHLGTAIGGNVGVGVGAPAPGAQMGAYQQPQLGHLNWNGSF